MLGEYLNLKGESLIAVIMPRATPEQSETEYKEIVKQIMDSYYPELVGWMAKQQIAEKAHNCKTIEEVEAMTYQLIPEDFFTVLTDRLNDINTINDSERLFLLAQLSDRIIFSARQYTQQMLHDRCKVIAAGNKRKIITR